MPALDPNWTPIGQAANRIVAHTVVADLLRRLAAVLGIGLSQAFALLQQAIVDFDLNELIEREGDDPAPPAPPPFSVR